MSGVELYLAVLGLLGTVTIPALQATFPTKEGGARDRGVRASAKSIAELHGSIGEEWFASIYSNLELYQQEVEPNVDGRDRAFAKNMRKSIYLTMERSRETAKELQNALQNRNSSEQIQRMQGDLEEYAKYLNHFQVSMMHRLLLRQVQRTSPDGRVFFVDTPSSSNFTLGPDIAPIMVSYDEDPQLNWPVNKGDIDLLKDLFNPSRNDPGPTSRPSRALLLACRECLPEVVELCLNYSADPTVMGDDGLGAIHNAVGTEDRMTDPPEIPQILSMLIDQGVAAATRDSTNEQLTPLHRAAMTKNVLATKLLLEKDPGMINLVDKEGKTALYHACAQPNQKLMLVEVLLDRDASFADKAQPPMPDHHGQEIERLINERFGR